MINPVQDKLDYSPAYRVLLTPPYGFNLFYMKSIIPKGITMIGIYKSVIPYVGLRALGLALVMIFPQIAMWFPGVISAGLAKG